MKKTATAEESLAWRLIAAGFAKFESTIRRGLRDVAQRSTPKRRTEFLEACLEGSPLVDLESEARFGPLAFEVLVAVSARYAEYRVSRGALRAIRELRAALGGQPLADFYPMLALAKKVARVCRERHAPLAGRASLPPEPISARHLSRDRLGDIAIAVYRRRLEAARGPLYGKRWDELRRIADDSELSLPEDRMAFLHDLEEGMNLARPRRSRRGQISPELRRNRFVALDMALADFRRDGLGYEDVVRETVAALAEEVKIPEEDAAGFMLYLAKTTRDP